ncbi:unnamed protein product [Blepharisma stoltei]|uniref:Uncharacterized protein n=1 Tax=Blepharisma stoltei TaxID=1481888 RepID=A0AAU9IYW6_9CILI|nr:unnamed protein product [Blepharisma stoltei]
MQSMKKIDYKDWILGGFVVFGASALLYYFIDKKDAKSKEKALIPKKDLEKILKDLDNELLGVYLNLSGLIRTLKEQTGNIDNEDIKEFVDSRFHISNKIQSIANKIYEKHSTTEEAVEKSCIIYEKTDKDIRDLSNLIKNNLASAYQGIDPQLSINVPDFLTADLTLEILEEMYATARMVSYERIEEVEKRGIKRDLQSKEFLDQVKNMDSLIEEAEYELFQKYGLYALKQAPKKVIRDAVIKYSQIDPIFNRQVLTIEEEHKSDMAMILRGQFSANKFEMLRNRLQKGENVVKESSEEFKNETEENENTNSQKIVETVSD